MRLHAACRFLSVLAVLLASAVTLAQEPLAAPIVGPDGRAPSGVRAPSPKYGTTNLTYVRVSGVEFFPPGGGGYNHAQGLGRFPTSGVGLIAGLRLPGGSIIDYLEIDFCDFLDPEDIQLFLLDCGPLGATCVTTVANVNSFANPGCSAISTSGIGYQVDNLGGSLALQAIFGASNNNLLELTGAVVGYRLQVSPAPGTATFNDVPTSDPAFQFIEALVASGITAGCGGGNYCPDATLTRRQMAVFLAKALGLQFP